VVPWGRAVSISAVLLLVLTLAAHDVAEGASSGWQYSTDRDQMRDALNRYASLLSSNSEGRAWDGSPMRMVMVVRRTAREGHGGPRVSVK
jgi:hypothetical protein